MRDIYQEVTDRILAGRYILGNDGKTPVPCPDLATWARWFETADRHVAQTTVGNVRVSTVFLGIDHNWSPRGPPLLFEGMIFGGTHDEEQRRYSTRDEAERGHAELVAMARSGLA